MATMITAQLSTECVTGIINTNIITAVISSNQSFSTKPTVDAYNVKLSTAESITAGITNETEIYKVNLTAIRR